MKPIIESEAIPTSRSFRLTSVNNHSIHPAGLSTVSRENREVSPLSRPLAQPAGSPRAGGFQPVERSDAQAPQKSPKMTTTRLRLATLTVLAAAGLATFAYHWWTVGRFIQSTDDAYVGGDATVIAPKVPGFIARLDRWRLRTSLAHS